MARTKEELREMNVMDPAFQAEVEKSPMPDLGDDLFTRRARRAQHLKRLRQFYPIPGPIPGVQERNRRLTMRDGGTISVRIYTPAQDRISPSGSPLYVAFHEGGWSMGDFTDEEMNCRMFSKELGAVCVNVEYRLAPEHPFPIGINDCWDTLKWVARNYQSLGANPEVGFAIGGASAGGNITAILAHLARDEKLDPPLTGQYLCVPAVMPPSSVPEKYKDEYISPVENLHDPVLQMSPGADPYEGLQEILKMDVDSPLFTPCKNPNKHAGLPRAFFQICGMDPLRDEGLCYEKLIREDFDVETKLLVYPGFGHMFWTNYPHLEKSNEFVKDTLEGIRWLFNGGKHS
ncbi:AB hydrolase superfamily protein B1A11.02 [Venturia nashicola]|uniref:AB hydrolase superfamily protein B1A11.02 n=1 Tax=Venturia nashicola TaxID=86259 RepID=A0A4Z1P9P6_9PEZI|nr:AB hydrolase superfamily protein B1A11.02 [Venturia nashicola]TLD38090.1 AB hydrolase superfamily protein B1A11.02 [Venturia nashicola]